MLMRSALNNMAYCLLIKAHCVYCDLTNFLTIIKVNFMSQSVKLLTLFSLPCFQYLHLIRVEVSFKPLSTFKVLLQPFSRFQWYQIFDSKEKLQKFSHFLLRIVAELQNASKWRPVRSFVTLESVLRTTTVTRPTFSALIYSELFTLHYSAPNGEHWYWLSHVPTRRRARNNEMKGTLTISAEFSMVLVQPWDELARDLHSWNQKGNTGLGNNVGCLCQNVADILIYMVTFHDVEQDCNAIRRCDLSGFTLSASQT
jgi:hypothetical protein